MERGLKQVWLAKKIRKSPAELNRWLKGKRIPTYENMSKIAKVLNVSVGGIFFNEDVPVSAYTNMNDANISGNKQPGNIEKKD
jgi:transcriptional regulator with XRE-family HTH domain